MSRLHLVRHGRAATAWDADLDPGLDEVGRSQAEIMAGSLAGIGPLPVVVSPRRRTLETAAPLVRVWGVEPFVEPGVGEIATPDGLGLAERGTWLRDLMGRRWPELDRDLRAWRLRVIDALWALEADAVVVTHFVAINVAVGWATADDRVVIVSPDHCSVTSLDRDAAAGRLALVTP